jgi:hypothetical protein
MSETAIWKTFPMNTSDNLLMKCVRARGNTSYSLHKEAIRHIFIMNAYWLSCTLHCYIGVFFLKRIPITSTGREKNVFSLNLMRCGLETTMPPYGRIFTLATNSDPRHTFPGKWRTMHASAEFKELNPRPRVYVEIPKPSRVELKCSQNPRR